MLLHLRPPLPATAPAPRMVDDALLRERKGQPMAPLIRPDAVLLRYMYDGGTLSQGRLCELVPNNADEVLASEVLAVLRDDGVDLRRFYPAVYETEESGGGWLPLRRGRERLDDVAIPLVPPVAEAQASSNLRRRIDVKLFRAADVAEAEAVGVGVGAGGGVDAWLAEAASQPSGTLRRRGYYGVGIVGVKNQANVGTLWRSAFQLGAAFIYTVGTRYRNQATDTVHALSRMPTFELDDWSAFVEWAPKGARYVAVEMGGEPLEDFEHPMNAIYILGSEDAGLPKAVLRACHAVVSLPSERYASYNVAMAGTVVMYDRLVKERRAEAEADAV